jgi:uncharacterized protein GlcG (DUF336 family)
MAARNSARLRLVARDGTVCAVAFGGGLALYDDNGVIGGLGVSGDTPCADHNVAWRMRDALG